MDPLILLAGLAGAGAVYIAVSALLNSAGATRRAVIARTSGATLFGQAGIQFSLPGREERDRKIVQDLERAGIALTPGEYLLIRFVFGFGVGFVLLLLSLAVEAPLILTFILFAFGFLIGQFVPAFYLGVVTGKRRKLIEDQLLEVLIALAKSLRAGVGLTQALDYAGRETADPLGSELQRIVRELQLGADIEVVFEELNGRVGSPDLEIATTAMIVQRRVGGNLSEILSNVANTIRERRAIRSELNAITAQQRLQGNLSALLPIFTALFFFAVNTDSARYLVETWIGLGALAIGLFFELVGLWLIRRFATVEV